MGGRINTIMQTCFFAISGVLPRDEAIAADQEGDREDLRQEGRRGRAAELRGGRRDARPPARGDGARRRVTAHAACRPPVVRRRRPTSCRRVTGGDAGRQGRPAAGQRVPGRRHLADRHRAVGEAQHRARDPGLGRDALHPVQQVRAGLPARRHPRQGLRPGDARRRAGDASSRRDYKGAEFKGMQVHDPGRARGLHRLQPLRRGLPGQGQDQPAAQGHRHGSRSRRCATRERDNYDFFLDLPEPDRTARRASTSRARSSSQPLFEFSGACAGCGETPYIKLLTQLFGDRAAHRQRHRLLVDLRRQPADDAVHAPTATAAARPGPTRSSRTTPSSASASGSASTSTREQARELLAQLAAAARRRPRAASCSTPTRRPRRASPRSASASRRCAQKLRRHRHARGAPPRALADYLVEEERLDRRRRRLGLRHRLRRPRPRPRLRAQRQHPRARHRGLLEHRRPGVEGDAARRRGQVRRRPARRPPKKDLGLMAMSYGHVYVAQRRLRRQGRADRARRSARPRRTRARR